MASLPLFSMLLAVAVAAGVIDDGIDNPVTTEAYSGTILADSSDDPMSHFNGTEIGPSATTNIMRSRRSLLNFYRGLKCTRPTCNPMTFLNYGCWCGYGGSGIPIDGIDQCCKEHDECYDGTRCEWFKEEYWRNYEHSCTRSRQLWCHHRPYDCAGRLCQCDSEFAACLKRFPCPEDKKHCS